MINIASWINLFCKNLFHQHGGLPANSFAFSLYTISIYRQWCSGALVFQSIQLSHLLIMSHSLNLHACSTVTTTILEIAY